MKNPFKKSTQIKHDLSDIQFVAKMQHKIDAYDEALTKLVCYIRDPNCIYEGTPSIFMLREIPESGQVFRFLLWIKQNQLDVFERFLKDELGDHPQ